MLTERRKAELRAFWHQVPSGGCLWATEDERHYLSTLGGQPMDEFVCKSLPAVDEQHRSDLRKCIARTLRRDPDFADLAPEQQADIEREICADNRWPRPIPVSERPPSKDQKCLFFVQHGHAEPSWHAGYFYINHFIEQSQSDPDCGHYINVADVSHWLPAPPDPE